MWLISDSYWLFILGGENGDFQTVSEFSFTVERKKREKEGEREKGAQEERERSKRESMFLK